MKPDEFRGFCRGVGKEGDLVFRIPLKQFKNEVLFPSRSPRLRSAKTAELRRAGFAIAHDDIMSRDIGSTLKQACT